MEGREIDLEPDAIVARLGGESGQPPEVVPLVGYLGGEVVDGHRRFFADDTLAKWIDIPESEIVDRRRIAGDEETLGERSVILVKRAAMNSPLREAQAEELQAAFLSGPFAAQPLLPSTMWDAAGLMTFFDEYTAECCSLRGPRSIRRCQ